MAGPRRQKGGPPGDTATDSATGSRVDDHRLQCLQFREAATYYLYICASHEQLKTTLDHCACPIYYAGPDDVAFTRRQQPPPVRDVRVYIAARCGALYLARDAGSLRLSVCV